MRWRSLASLIWLSGLSTSAGAQTGATARPAASDNVAALGTFEVVELRRYTTTEGKREHFARYFETYFPEAFEQLGAIAAGSFFERGHRDVSPGFVVSTPSTRARS